MAKQNKEEILENLIQAARKAGADAADALLVEGVSAGVSYRLGKLEDVERAESRDLGLRVFVGARVAFVSSTDLSEDRLAELPERAVAMAKLAPEDKYAGLAPRELLARDFPSLDLEDASEPSTETLIERAKSVEGAAMAVKGITNSEGGGASYGRTGIALATSEGFRGSYAATSHGIGVAAIPDYVAAEHKQLVRVLPDVPGPSFDVHLVYADALRQAKRVAAFRDFLVRSAKDWCY